jgi:hypothetical protein
MTRTGYFERPTRFILASHFFWGLWAVVNASVSTIPFGYWVINVLFIFKDGN